MISLCIWLLIAQIGYWFLSPIELHYTGLLSERSDLHKTLRSFLCKIHPNFWTTKAMFWDSIGFTRLQDNGVSYVSDSCDYKRVRYSE